MLSERHTPRPREPVRATTPACVLAPVAGEHTRSLQPVQNGIHRALGQVEGVAASQAELFDHPIPVPRSLGENREHQHLEMALECLPSHT
jgi:hypothetical protein